MHAFATVLSGVPFSGSQPVGTYFESEAMTGVSIPMAFIKGSVG